MKKKSPDRHSSSEGFWAAESRRRSGARDWSYAALQVYCAHIIENPEDPNGFRRAAECFLTGLPTALAVLCSYAVLESAPGDDKAARIVKHHAATASERECWKWIDRSSDETVLLGLLYAMLAAEKSGVHHLETGRVRLTNRLNAVAPQCDDPIFRGQLQHVHALARAEERGGNLIDRVARNGLSQPESVRNPLGGPKRTRRAKIRLWTGRSGER